MTKSFNEVALLWKAEKRKWVKDATYATYLQHLKNHILPYFASLPKIGEEQIQGFIDLKAAEGKSPKSIRDMMLVLKMILRYGEKIQAWPRIEFEVHYPAKAELSPQLQVLSLRHQKQLLNYLMDSLSYRNAGILICLLGGLRIGEVSGLQWKDIDMDAGIIRVRKTVQRIYLADGNDHRYYLSIGTPKTATSVRDIPIPHELMTRLKTLRKTADPEHFVVSNEAMPMEPRRIRNYYTQLLRQLGIPPLRFHAMRHSFATRCIESGCEIKTVSAILGHASISTTLDLYVHPGLDEKKKAIERMARSLR